MGGIGYVDMCGGTDHALLSVKVQMVDKISASQNKLLRTFPVEIIRKW